jgi:hypothetical protein
VGDVGGDTGCAGDIVEREGGDERVELHEERQRLPDAAGRAEDSHLALRLPRGGGVAAAAGELGGGSHQRRPHCGFRLGCGGARDLGGREDGGEGRRGE